MEEENKRCQPIFVRLRTGTSRTSEKRKSKSKEDVDKDAKTLIPSRYKRRDEAADVHVKLNRIGIERVPVNIGNTEDVPLWSLNKENDGDGNQQLLKTLRHQYTRRLFIAECSRNLIH